MLELFRSPRRAIVWFVEASLLALLALGAAGLTLGWARALGYEHCLHALLLSVVAQASMYYHGLYGPRPIRLSALVLGFVRALGVAAAVLWTLSHLVPHEAFARGIFVALGGAAVILPAWRAAYQRVSSSESFRSPVLILGAGPLARACAALLEGESDLGLRLSGLCLHEREAAPPGLTVLGRHPDLARLCAEHGIARIIVACEDRRGTLPVDALIDLKFRGVEVEEAIDFYERVTGRISVPALKPSDVIFARGFSARRRTHAVKRAFDVAASAVGLVLALPLLGLAAIAIKLDTPGPVLYSQVRAGAFGRPFRVRKLRSMRTDAETSGPVWAAEHDPRVTRVGRFLRRTRLDEVPQLWNVLVGEMSLVGPRPERPVFIAQIERSIPFFRQRLCVKPGVTGHAQVRCRYGASVEDALEKLEYDLFYIKRLSLWFDLSILIDTVKVVLLRIGSR
jgi:sugar transferase (PEP-CTERM system associated)